MHCLLYHNSHKFQINTATLSMLLYASIDAKIKSATGDVAAHLLHILTAVTYKEHPCVYCLYV